MTSLPPAASLACSSADAAISRSTGRQRSVLRPRVGLLKPGVELELVVAFVGEAATTLEVGLQIALQPLDDALGLRIGRLAEPPSDLQLATQRRELAGRASAVAVDAGLAIPDQRLRQGAQRPQAASDPPEQIRCLLGEHQRAGARARVAQAPNHHPGTALLEMPDRDRR